MKRATLLRCCAILLTSLGFATGTVHAQRSWMPLGAMVNARHYHSAVALSDSEAMVMGGYINSTGGLLTGTITTSVEIINIRTRTVRRGPSMWDARAEFATVVTPDSNVVVVSGISNTSGLLTPNCEMYDRKRRTWSRVGTLLDARRQHSACMLNDHQILVVGGRDQFNILGSANAEILDLNTGTSRRISDYPLALNLPCAARTRSGHALVVGGRVGGAGSARTTLCSVYDTTADTWTQTSSLPTAATAVATVTMPSGNAVFIGGSSGDGPGSGVVDVTEEFADVVTPVAQLLKGRVWHSVSVWNADSIIVAGGQDYDNQFAAMPSTEWINITTGRVTQGPPMIVARKYGASVTLRDIDCMGRVTFPATVMIGGLAPGDTNATLVEVLEDPHNFRPSYVVDSVGAGGVIDFGRLPLSTLRCKTFYVVNTGAAPLTLDSCALRRGTTFSVAGGTWPLVLQPGARGAITVCFFAVDSTLSLDTATVFGQCIASTIPLAAQGQASPCNVALAVDSISPTSVLDFGNVTVFDTACGTVRIRNNGAASLVVDSLWWTYGTRFTYAGFTVPFTIAAHDFADLAVCVIPGDSLIERDALLVRAQCATVTIPVAVRGTLRAPQCGGLLDLGSRTVTVSAPYPNPSITDLAVHVEIVDRATLPGCAIACVLQDALGRIAAQTSTVLAAGQWDGRLNLGALPSGAYVCVVTAGRNAWRFPVTIAR